MPKMKINKCGCGGECAYMVFAGFDFARRCCSHIKNKGNIVDPETIHTDCPLDDLPDNKPDIIAMLDEYIEEHEGMIEKRPILEDRYMDRIQALLLFKGKIEKIEG